MIDYRIWGQHLIDCDPEKPKTPFTQMNAAMSIEPAVAGALMPDAHVGYGLPIGGVLGLDDAVCPYAVGVDIACRMKLSIFEIVRGCGYVTRRKAGSSVRSERANTS